jgi:hypothetical protein
MNILKSFFGNKINKEPKMENINSEKTDYSDNLLKDLFVDNNPPTVESHEDSEIKSKIAEFLNINFESMGLRDGYEFGTQELLDNKIKKIKSDFLMIIEEMIDDKKLAIIKLENQKISIGGISLTIVQQLDVVIVETKNSIGNLEKQLELSVDDEGWVMNAIHPFKDGFIRGLLSKTQETNFLNSFSNFTNIK